MRRFFLLLGIIALLSGCGSTKMTEWNKDAPISTRDDSPAEVINFPDGYSNVASKCNHGNRLYVLYHGDGSFGAVTVVREDRTCPR
ncbi:MAG TPA: membrane lipoprotein lipid attachment site-containing protein [Candidatus Paceibacterota bacterium]|nr:membrane lipoprotein lipid attachment site-containing protein [Candidatus Paceibacterota bacterium]